MKKYVRKLVVAPISNTIYWARVDDDLCIMSHSDRTDFTDNALSAVLTHLTSMRGFSETGFAGYEYPKKDRSGSATLCAFTSDSHVCISKKLYDELLEYKAKYENEMRRVGREADGGSFENC